MGTAANADVRFRPIGVSDVDRATKQISSSAGQMQARMGSAARTAAGGFEQMARSGRVAGDGLKQIIASGADMAFTFGRLGPIAGAVGILGLAIYSVFDRTRKEIEETRKKAIDTLREIRSLSLESAQERAQLLFGGDPFGATGLDQSSIPALEEEVARLSRQRARAKIGLAPVLTETETRRLTLATTELLERHKEHELVMAQVNRQMERMVGIQTRLIEIDRDKTAERAREKAIQDAEKQLAIDVKRLQLRLAGRDFLALNGAPPQTRRTPGDSETPINPADTRRAENLAKAKAEAEALAGRVAGIIESTFTGAIQNAFSRAFSGEGFAGLFKGLGQTILAGLGAVFIDIGKSLLAFGAIMEKVKAAILSGPFGAGIGAIVAGTALIALGAAMSAAAGGRTFGSSSGGGFGALAPVSQQAENITRITIDPTSAGAAAGVAQREATTVVYFGNRRDPEFERWLRERVDRSRRRRSQG